MSAAVGQRHQFQHPSMLRSASRPGTPSFYASFGSPAILQSPKGTHKDGEESPSRFTRAASDPPPSESAKSHLLRNNFELEPNPFEQSFSSIRSSDTRSTARDGVVEEEDKKPARRARSQSPGAKRTPSGGAVLNRLPAVSSIISPSVGQPHDAHSFGWGMDHSLRSGPLSPAMLHGPTSASNGGFGMSSYFDANSFRTGLTPSGSGSLSFAPQSPNTAALFAMMTNQGQTPDVHGMTSAGPHSGLVGMHQPGRSERDMPNHFDTGFGAAMSTDKKDQSGGLNGNRIGMSMPASTMSNGGQPLAVSEAMPGLSMQPVPKPFNAAQRAVLQGQGTGAPRPFGSQPLSQPGVIHPSQVNGFPNAPGQGNSNPLFLLSQAAPELRNNGNEDAVLAATALSALNGSGSPYSATSPDNHIPLNQGQGLRQASPPQPAPGPPRAKRASAAQQAAAAAQAEASQASSTSSGGRKRKGAAAAEDDYGDVPPPAKVGRKKGSKKAKVEEPPMSDDGGEMDQDGTGSATGSGKFETEEEKRKNFLERNRQAALKCRQRKKAWLQSLQSKVELLTADNETLQSTVNALREEIGTLRSVLINHKDCPIMTAGDNGMSTIGNLLGHPRHQQQY